MRKLHILVVFSAMTLSFLPVHAAEPESPSAGLISLSLEGVDLDTVLRMFSRMTGANIQYNPIDLSGAQRVLVSLTDEPWRPALQAILADRGLVLVTAPGGRNSYSIVKADKPETAVRIQYASAAVTLAEAVLADIKSNNVSSATAHLQAFADANRQTVKAFDASQRQPKKESANTASHGTGCARP